MFVKSMRYLLSLRVSVRNPYDINLVNDESPVFIVTCINERHVLSTYLDGSEINAKTYHNLNQYPEVGYWVLRGMLEL